MIRRIRSFLFRDQRGVAAIEFGLLAPAFFMLMIAIIEICYYVYMSTSIQRAVEKAVFDLRTNHAATEVQDNNLQIKEWYEQAICSRVFLSTCEESLTVTIETYDDEYEPYWSTSNADELTLAPRETVMRVEAELNVPALVFTPLVLGDGASRMAAGITFMTEP